MSAKLSETNKSKFYDFIVLFEHEISSNYGHYKLTDTHVVDFCTTHSILLGSDCKTNNSKISGYKYYILWDDRKPTKYKSVNHNDSAHNLLRHIRNAMAHGNVSAENRQKFMLSDLNEAKRQTMRGKISSTLFFDLISCIINTYTI